MENLVMELSAHAFMFWGRCMIATLLLYTQIVFGEQSSAIAIYLITSY